MKSQKSLEQFYDAVKDGKLSDLNHSFVKGNNIYLHATSLENLENILNEGFDPNKSKFKYCYFGKSLHISKQYGISKSTRYVILAVDLSELFESDDNQDKYHFADTEVKVSKLVAKENIIGVLKFQ